MANEGLPAPPGGNDWGAFASSQPGSLPSPTALSNEASIRSIADVGLSARIDTLSAFQLSGLARLSSPNVFTEVNKIPGLRVGTFTVGSDYLMTSTDFEVLVDANAGPVTITLPAAMGNGQYYHIKKIDSTANVVTVTAAGTDVIDDSMSVVLADQWSDITLIDASFGFWDNAGTGGGTSVTSAGINSLIASVEQRLSTRIDGVSVGASVTSAAIHALVQTASAAGTAANVHANTVSVRLVSVSAELNSLLNSVEHRLSTRIDAVSGAGGSVTSQEVSALVQTASAAATSADAHANTVSARAVSISAELGSLIQIASAAATSADAHANTASAAATSADAHANTVSARVVSVSAELASLVQIASAAATSADAHANTVSARAVSISAELNSLLNSIESRLSTRIDTASSGGSVTSAEVQVASAAATSADAHAAAASAAATSADAHANTVSARLVSASAELGSLIQIASAAATSADAHANTASAAATSADVHANTASAAATSADAHANTVSARAVSISAEVASLVQIASAAATSADAHANAASAAAIANDASVSAAILADVASHLTSLHTSITAEIASVSAIIKTDIASVSAAIKTDTTSAINVLSNLASNWVSVTRYIPQSTQTADYTLVLGDAGTEVQMNKATAINLTVPPNSSVAFPVGTQIIIEQLGAGTVTIVAGAGVTLQGNLTTKFQYSSAVLIKQATDTWQVTTQVDLASISAVIKTDINSVSAAIMADVASHMTSLHTSVTAEIASVSAIIKTDIASVSAAIKTDIASVSAAIKTDTTSAINVLSNLASNWVSAAANASTATSSPALSNAISNDASVSAVIKTDVVSAINVLSNLASNWVSAAKNASTAGSSPILSNAISNDASVSAAILADVASHLTSLHTSITAEIASVSALINNVSSRTSVGGATSTKGIQSAINNLSANDLQLQSAYQGASTVGSIAALSIASAWVQSASAAATSVDNRVTSASAATSIWQGWTGLYVITNDFTTSNTTATDITGLVSGTLAASTLYMVEVMVKGNGADANGLKFAWHGGGSGSAATCQTNGGFGGAFGTLAAIDTLSAATWASATDATAFQIGWFTTRSTGTPTISFQVAKVTSGTATIRKGSYLRIRAATIA